MARDQALINTDCLAELIYVSAVDPWAVYPVNVPYRPGAPRGQSFLSLELIYVYVLYILSWKNSCGGGCWMHQNDEELRLVCLGQGLPTRSDRSFVRFQPLHVIFFRNKPTSFGRGEGTPRGWLDF